MKTSQGRCLQMAKTSSASKIVLNSFNDLFGMTDSENKVTEVRDVMIDELFEFKNHPFKVVDDKKMQELRNVFWDMHEISQKTEKRTSLQKSAKQKPKK